MKSNAINYLSLARKAGRIEVGEEPTGAAARAGKARLVILASDAPENTCRRARNFVAGTDQQLVTAPFSKEELGAAVGRTVVAMAAFTDPALALSFLKALGDDGQYAGAMENLTVKTRRIRRRQEEARAHERNLRLGKKKHPPQDGAKQDTTVNRPAGQRPGKKHGGA